MNGVMVYTETADGRISSSAVYVLGYARQIADELERDLVAVLIGEGVSESAREVIELGADMACVFDDTGLNNYDASFYLAALEAVVNAVAPQIILMGHSAYSVELSSRLSCRLETAAVHDCVDLAVDADTKRLLFTKPVYGGNANAVYSIESDPQMGALRDKVGFPTERDPARGGEILYISARPDPSAAKTILRDRVVGKDEGVALEDARVVVSGGRGMSSQSGFAHLSSLARLLGGAVGASRPACDNGWAPLTSLIGLTGKIVSPDIYFAVGISGALQHMAGCSRAKAIIAINKDPEANVFNEANYGVIADWREVLPALTKKVEELLAA